MKHIPNILMVLILSIFGTAMYLLFFERPWLVYKNIPFPPVISRVHAGEVIPLHVIRCNSGHSRRTYRFTHSLVNDSRPTSFPVVLPDTVASVEAGCVEINSEANQIPINTLPGTYHIIGIAEIQMTMGTVFVEWYSQPFEVIK